MLYVTLYLFLFIASIKFSHQRRGYLGYFCYFSNEAMQVDARDGAVSQRLYVMDTSDMAENNDFLAYLFVFQGRRNSHIFFPTYIKLLQLHLQSITLLWS